MMGKQMVIPVEGRRRRAAEAAARLVDDGARLGLGSGRTAGLFVEALAARVAASGMRVTCVATSERTERLARGHGLPVVAPETLPALDLAVDGADEVDGALDLVKGRGGALVRERIVARAAARFLVVVDDEKRVTRLGRGPIPVEIVGFGSSWTLAALRDLGAADLLRDVGGTPVRTDNGNLLAGLELPADDRRLATAAGKRAFAAAVAALPGVVDHGLFLDMADAVLVGAEDGSVTTLHRAVGR
jgi:ribose 5-phosphate isomerase A